MWSLAGLLLLYVAACHSLHYEYRDQNDMGDEYPGSYHFGEDVVTMPEISTANYREYMKVDFKKMFITPDMMWLGIRSWPINITSTTISSTQSSTQTSMQTLNVTLTQIATHTSIQVVTQSSTQNSTQSSTQTSTQSLVSADKERKRLTDMTTILQHMTIEWTLDDSEYETSSPQSSTVGHLSSISDLSRIRRDQQNWQTLNHEVDDNVYKYFRAPDDTNTTTEQFIVTTTSTTTQTSTAVPTTTTTTLEPTTTTTTVEPTTTEPFWTYPSHFRTYRKGNRAYTYPRSIFVNGTWYMLPWDWPFNTQPTYPPPTTITTTMTTTTKPPTLRMDIVGLLSLIANLTYFYDMNLTERFNETLIKYGVPTCATPTTTFTTSPTTPVYDFANTTIVGKCFVCGLDKEAIPQDAYCADAFAGDFLPLMPSDPRAKGQIARYRKYCRYLDIRHYELNPEEPRAVYGRFTGGCSVRWTDLTGVYTQRACRNKRRAVLGKHFASKRMAKLEMALSNVDNGCIISPMATLLPLSRGVSLYARFHACVCTGAWCNRAARHDPWSLYIVLLTSFYTFR